MPVETRDVSVYIVPRWSGTPSSDWYPWLSKRLAEAGHVTRALDLPDPSCPRIESWSRGIADALGTDAAALEATYVIGHSVGCQAVLHALAGLPDGLRIAGVLMVAGWFDVDEPWETIRPWLEASPDCARARGVARRRHVLLSDDDPFTADFAKTRSAWEDKLGASVTVRAGGKHFNSAEEPAVLAAAQALLGAED